MEIYPTDIIAMVAIIVLIGAVGFLIYFKLEDKRQEQKQKQP